MCMRINCYIYLLIYLFIYFLGCSSVCLSSTSITSLLPPPYSHVCPLLQFSALSPSPFSPFTGSSSSGGGLEEDALEVEKEGEAEEGETSSDRPSLAERNFKESYLRRKEMNGNSRIDNVDSDSVFIKCDKNMEQDKKRRRDFHGELKYIWIEWSGGE